MTLPGVVAGVRLDDKGGVTGKGGTGDTAEAAILSTKLATSPAVEDHSQYGAETAGPTGETGPGTDGEAAKCGETDL